MVRLTDRPDMTLDVYHGRKTTMQQQQLLGLIHYILKGLLPSFNINVKLLFFQKVDPNFVSEACTRQESLSTVFIQL